MLGSRLNNLSQAGEAGLLSDGHIRAKGALGPSSEVSPTSKFNSADGRSPGAGGVSALPTPPCARGTAEADVFDDTFITY